MPRINIPGLPDEEANVDQLRRIRNRVLAAVSPIETAFIAAPNDLHRGGVTLGGVGPREEVRDEWQRLAAGPFDIGADGGAPPGGSGAVAAGPALAGGHCPAAGGQSGQYLPLGRHAGPPRWPSRVGADWPLEPGQGDRPGSIPAPGSVWVGSWTGAQWRRALPLNAGPSSASRL